MAAFTADIRKLATLAGCLLLAAQAHAAGPKVPTGPIDMTADSTDIDYKNKILTYRKVRIAQGSMAITADTGQANSTKVETAFDNSRWVFRGTVKITVEQGTLNSDEAQVTFTNKVLSVAVANGKPATFQQKVSNSDTTAQGHAENIEYDAPKGVVVLTKNAWLSTGDREMRAESIRYDTLAQKITAPAAEQGQQRVHIIIQPPANTKP
jgi:lipopolysaccharide transport protein LptA